MGYEREILKVQQDCKEAVQSFIDALSEVGLKFIPTFDLQSACAPPGSPCPHHGRVPCSCQLVVLMVYDLANVPHSIVAHGFDGQTRFSLIETPGEPKSSEFASLVSLALEMVQLVE